MSEIDKKIYNKLVEIDSGENQIIPSTEYGTAFFIHIVFKGIPVVLFILRKAFGEESGKSIMIQLFLLALVIDFWLTKNVVGRKMLGLRWSFDDDQYGIERFKFQGRVNDEQCVSSLGKKLFWIIQVIYMIIPLLFILGYVLIDHFRNFQLDNIFLLIAFEIAAGSNFFFFWKASSAAEDRRYELKKKLGTEMTKNMGNASVISFL